MTSKLDRARALQRQVSRLQRRAERLRLEGERRAWLRLAVFLAGAGLSVIAFALGAAPVGAVVALAALIAFAAAVAAHRRVDRAAERCETWLRLKAAHLARLRLDWDRLPPGGTRPVPYTHPFGADLDIAGDRSLLRLIDASVTSDGRERLRGWLLAPVPDVAAVRARQALVRELLPLSAFRDRLALNALLGSDDVSLERWTGAELGAWASSGGLPLLARRLAPALAGLALLTAALFLLSTFAGWPGYWSVSLLVYVGLYLTQWRAAGQLLDEAAKWEGVLRKLRAVFAQLERYGYPAQPRLRELCAPFLEARERPSAQLARIEPLVAAASLQRNPLLGIALNALLPYNLLVALWMDAWRARAALRLPGWLNVWFELEALASLANFGYLNPGYAFPALVAGDCPGVFCARALGHPLIPDDARVCNDFTLQSLGETVIVTGSNMSGKSSFLRTLGVNLCLAYAGGPVAAESLQTAAFRLYTAITVSDSVTDGISYFYAEVKRLKALLAAFAEPGALPLFALIDEIFKGTNNRERLQGSRAYVRALAGGPGITIISTHDLELVQLADELPQVRNYHFEDSVRDGQMVFDYRLRPGPSPTTNALRIMAMEGLPVAADG